MKKVMWIFVLCAQISLDAVALYDLGMGLLNTYLGPKDYINNSARTLRIVTKSFYKAKGLLGGDGFEALQESYLFPKPGLVPKEVQDRLKMYAYAPVTSVAPRVFVEALRKDVSLGEQELKFVGERLRCAIPLFKAAYEGMNFVDPDTAVQFTDIAYGYALDRGLKEELQTEQFIPRIGLVFSGGGFRAMIATLGCYQALSDIGIMGSILYSANLSGSTWCTIPWCLGATLKELETTYDFYARVGVGKRTISDIKKYVLPWLNTTVLKDKLMTTFLWDQPLSSVRGLWGPVIGQMVMSFWDDPRIREETNTKHPYQSSQYFYMWQVMDAIENGKTRPFPIATALIPFEGNFFSTASNMAAKQKTKNGLWMEFNPESVGFEYLDNGVLKGVYLPTFALGRQFVEVPAEPSRWYRLFTINKKILGWESKSGPVQTLDYWLGAWGSAFTVAPSDLYRILFLQGAPIIIPEADRISLAKEGTVVETTENLTLINQRSWISEKLMSLFAEAIQYASDTVKDATTSLFGVRLYPARFNNFARYSDSPFSKADTFAAVDAGIDFNLPLPPLLRPGRDLDLIIVCDWSEATPEYPAKELCLAEQWAHRRGVPFPKVGGFFEGPKSQWVEASSSYDTVYKRPMTLFNEYPEGQFGPAILYIPLQENKFNEKHFSVEQCFKGACSTFNFDYFKDGENQLAQLSNQVYRTIWGVYPQIREVVQGIVDSKNNNEPFMMKKLSEELLAV